MITWRDFVPGLSCKKNGIPLVHIIYRKVIHNFFLSIRGYFNGTEIHWCKNLFFFFLKCFYWVSFLWVLSLLSVLFVSFYLLQTKIETKTFLTKNIYLNKWLWEYFFRKYFFRRMNYLMDSYLISIFYLSQQ